MKRNHILRILFGTVCSVLLLVSCRSGSVDEFAYLYRDLPFDMPKVSRPVIPAYSVELTEFGAVGDGVTRNTEAFAKAMQHLADKGGGHLNVPAGLWLTGPVEILSNCDLHLSENAVIIFDPDRSLYPIVSTVFEGLDTRRCESPIHADGAKNISITGSGVIDGNGDAWRMVKKSKMAEGEWKRLLAGGGVLSPDGNTWYPDEGFLKATRMSNMNVPRSDLSEAEWNEIKSFLRPNLVQIRNCENVLLEGVTFQNSPCWNVHPLMCKNLIVSRVNIRNPWYSQNGDAIDVDSCENVLIVNSIFDAGDDGICIKSGKERIEQAVKAAFESPLLNDFDLKTAKKVLVNITCGHNDQGLTMDDLNEINKKIDEYTGRANNFKRGLIWDDDPEIGDKIRITSIVTGLRFSDVIGPAKDMGNYIMIGRDFTYNKAAAASGEGISLFEDTGSQQIGFNSKSNVRTFQFDPDEKPALILTGGERLAELENVPAIRRAKS